MIWRKSEQLILVAIVVVALGFALMPWRRPIGSWLNPPRPSPIAVLETRLAAEHLDFIKWEIFRHTRGTNKTGPTFPNALVDRDGQEVTLAGYMVPLDQYDEVDRFVLVPLKLVCRVCQAPPSRDQVLVQLDRPTNLITNLVVVHGTLVLHTESGKPFFCTVSGATVSPGLEEEDPVPLVVPKEHRHPPEGQKIWVAHPGKENPLQQPR